MKKDREFTGVNQKKGLTKNRELSNNALVFHVLNDKAVDGMVVFSKNLQIRRMRIGDSEPT